jgi:MFS family permease
VGIKVQVGKTLLMVILCISHSMNHSLLLVLPPLLLIASADLKITLGTLSQIAAIGMFMYGGGAILGGAISDRVGEERAITLSMALSGLSTLLVFLLPGVYGIGVGLFMIATWSSIYHPTANSFIIRVYKEKMAQYMSWHGVGGALGTMTAPIISTAVGLAFGWRYPYLLFGSLAIVTSLFFYRYRSDVSPPKARATKTGYLEIIRIKALRPLFIYSLPNGLILKGIEFFFPTVLASKGFPVEIAGFALSGVLICGVVGQFVGGRVSEKTGMRDVVVAGSAMTLAGLLLFHLLPQPYGALMLILMYGVGFYATIPAFNVIAGKASPEDKRGTIFGLFFLINFGIGSISTSIGGIIIDKVGIGYVFILLTGLAVALLLAALRIKRDRPEKRVE